MSECKHENLFYGVKFDSIGRTYAICHCADCYKTPREIIIDLRDKLAAKDEQIRQMRNCGNCAKWRDCPTHAYAGNGCDSWQMREGGER